MAYTSPYDPGTCEARSSWLAGLTEAVSIVTKQLDLKATEVAEEIKLNELLIDDDDRYRIYQAEKWNKLWLTDPEPIITKNGDVIKPDTDGFTIDYLGGSIAFNDSSRLTAEDEVKATVKHLLSGDDAHRSIVLEAIQENLKTFETSINGKQDKLTFDDEPLEESDNPVKSRGIYAALQNVHVELPENIVISVDEDLPTVLPVNADKLGGYEPEHYETEELTEAEITSVWEEVFGK